MLIVAPLALAVMTGSQTPEWSPKEGALMTRWAKDVSPQRVHPDYPRPQMVRQPWLNLNGLWDLTIKNRETTPALGRPDFQTKILVPFPVESALSGVMQSVDPNRILEYRRTFRVPAGWRGKRVMLHFGAVDWETTVFVNGKEAGKHRGGYDPFSFDVTDLLKPTGDQELLVRVWDPTNSNWQPIGKQILKPEGIWYAPTSGIWQTVWLEPVHERGIRGLKIDATNIEANQVIVEFDAKTAKGDKFFIKVLEGDEVPVDYSGVEAKRNILKVRNAKRWSPESPFLYGLVAGVKDQAGNVLDQVRSYFGFRKVSLGKDDKGRTKILLNGKPYFLVGPLDQGFWPDGLYTAPTEAALRYDLEITKRLGFNFVRKHVKVEPARWYYHCDRLGLAVFQDMPSGDKYIGGRDPDIMRTPESGENFKNELKAMIEGKRNHPCIIGWVPYNEGWGQWQTAEITEFVRKLDPNRLVDSASGWTDRGTGDMNDIHAYPGPASPKPEADRAAFLGEFGGLGLPVEGHMWQKTGWGYRSYKTKEELTDAYVGLFQNLRFLIDDPGLSGAVYTQTTDVETELNGLMTYDRALIKLDVQRARRAVEALFLPPPKVETVIPTSEVQGFPWRYTFAKSDLSDKSDRSDLAWAKPGFDASHWPLGSGGFGTRGTPGAVVRTDWNTPDIWLRRDIHLNPQTTIRNPHLRIHHDEDVEVYLDGELLIKRTGYTTGYVLIPIPASEARRLTVGRHILAVHCRQTGGGQYVDLGIVNVVG